VYLLLLPTQDPRPGVKIRTRLYEIDFTGTILIGGALISGIMAISFGGAIYAWGSGSIIALFVCSGVLWILFVTQQTLCFFTNETRRLFPLEMAKSYEMVLLFILTACSITSCFLPIYFVPLYFQFAISDSALGAAVRLLPFVFVLVSAVIFNGVLMGKIGYYKPFFLTGAILVLTGSSLMYTLDLNSGSGKVYGYSAILALGTGLFSQASFPVAQAKVESNLVSAATAFIGCAQIGGLTIALSIANSIFINVATNKISAILPNMDLVSVRQAISGAKGDLFQGLTASQKMGVLEAIVSSIQKVYIMVIAAGALAVISSVFMKGGKLFFEPESNSPSGSEANPSMVSPRAEEERSEK